MKVNFNQKFKDLKGQEVEGIETMNKVIAEQLVLQEAKENTLQKYELAMKLSSATKEIEITDSEKNLIKIGRAHV